MKLLLLPGLDGTGRLFRPFVEALPSGLEPEVVSYPADLCLSYEELLLRIAVPSGPFAIVGESFSGPLAIRLAAARPAGLRGLILVGTFARQPMPRFLGKLAHPALFSLRPPEAALRALLTDSCVRDVADAIASVRPEVLAHRIREVLAVDVARELAAVDVPILTLAGRRDRLVRPAPLRADATHVVLDAPHLVLQSRPREAAAAIVEWISRSSR